MLIAILILLVAAVYAQHGILAAILAVFASAAVYVLVALVHGVHRCPRCRGKRVITGKRSARSCPVCKGSGRTRRLASAPISRFAWSVAGPSLRARLEIRHEELRQAAGYEQ